MTDHELVAAVEAMQADSSRKGKEEKFAALLETTVGKTLVYHTYNPFRNWGITFKKKPPEGVDNGLDNQFGDFLPLLDQLASRSLTGNAAKDAVDATFAELNPAAAKLLWWILNKDLKAGVGATMIKKLSPNLIPFFSVARADTYDRKFVKDEDFPVAVEPKIDGYRLTFLSMDGQGAFYTRAGKPIPSMDHLVPDILELLRFCNLWLVDTLGATSVDGIPNMMIDGEVKTEGENFEDMSGTLRQTSEDATGAIYHIFDMMTLEAFQSPEDVEASYMVRRALCVQTAEFAEQLAKHDKIRATTCILAANHDEIDEIYSAFLGEGFEGAMVKFRDHGYVKSKSRSWLKVKPKDTEDLPIVGFFQGEPNKRYENTLGGIIVNRKGVEVRVYSGISDELREKIWNDKASYLNVLAEIEFQEETAAGSLRHARLIRLRTDKTGE